MASFKGRALDQIWFYFFLIHIPITLVMDLQAVYPHSWIVNTPLPGFNKWYLGWSRDPVIGGAHSGAREWQWLWVFLHLEAFVQLPCFVLGAWGLYRNDKRVYPLILFYGASTATTVIPVIYYTLTETVKPPLTTMELAALMSSYVPFLLIPLGMAVDMWLRINKLIQVAEGRKRA